MKVNLSVVKLSSGLLAVLVIISAIFLMGEQNSGNAAETDIEALFTYNAYVDVFICDATGVEYCKACSQELEKFSIVEGYPYTTQNLSEGQAFCIQADATQNTPTEPFGPYVANPDCVLTLDTFRDNHTSQSHRIFYATQDCVPTANRNTIHNLLANDAFVVFLYEQGKSTDCDENSGRGDLIFEHTIDPLYNSLDPQRSPPAYKNFFMDLPPNTKFCVEVTDVPEHFISLPLLHRFYGPFTASSTCRMDLAQRGTGDEAIPTLTPSKGCVSTDDIKVTSDSTRNWQLYFYNRGTADCTGTNPDIKERGPVFSYFKLYANESRYTANAPPGGEFCLVTEYGSDTGYFGPYKNSGSCEIIIGDTYIDTKGCG